MDRWQRVLIEIYRTDRYEGRWVAEWDDVGIDLPTVRSFIESLRRDERYQGGTFRFLQDGDDLVIAVFLGIQPPAAPKSGTALTPGLFGIDD